MSVVSVALSLLAAASDWQSSHQELTLARLVSGGNVVRVRDRHCKALIIVICRVHIV